MDRTGIIVVSLCAVLLFVWFYETSKQAQRLQQQQAEYQRTHPQPVATNGTQSQSANASTTSTSAVSAVPFDTNAPEQTIVMTNNRVRYTFTSRGGGIKLVELLDHPETISLKWQKNSNA